MNYVLKLSHADELLLNDEINKACLDYGLDKDLFETEVTKRIESKKDSVKNPFWFIKAIIKNLAAEHTEEFQVPKEVINEHRIRISAVPLFEKLRLLGFTQDTYDTYEIDLLIDYAVNEMNLVDEIYDIVQKSVDEAIESEFKTFAAVKDNIVKNAEICKSAYEKIHAQTINDVDELMDLIDSLKK